jgi:hypothetical protein
MKPWNKYKLDECNHLLQPLPLLPALMQDTGAVSLLQPLPLLPALMHQIQGRFPCYSRCPRDLR